MKEQVDKIEEPKIEVEEPKIEVQIEEPKIEVQIEVEEPKIEEQIEVEEQIEEQIEEPKIEVQIEEQIEEKEENIFKKMKKVLFKKNPNNEITIVNCIKENYLTWIAILTSIFIISPNNYFKSFASLILIFLIVYFSHILSHIDSNNIFSLLHRYHHKNNNFFSHFVQYIVELGFPVIFLPIYYIHGTTIIDEWIIIFSALFYSTIHNINYGYFHVNDVHSMHHKDYLTNIGPDICDIIFGTKNHSNKSVENTNHYIPNIIVVTIIILFFQYLYKNERYKNILRKLSMIFSTICAIIYINCTLFVYYFIEK